MCSQQYGPKINLYQSPLVIDQTCPVMDMCYVDQSTNPHGKWSISKLDILILSKKSFQTSLTAPNLTILVSYRHTGQWTDYQTQYFQSKHPFGIKQIIVKLKLIYMTTRQTTCAIEANTRASVIFQDIQMFYLSNDLFLINSSFFQLKGSFIELTLSCTHVSTLLPHYLLTNLVILCGPTTYDLHSRQLC